MCFATCYRFRLPVTLWFPYPVFPGYLLLRLALNPLRGSHLPSPSLLRSSSGCRNLRLLSIRCAFRPHLRSRLTQGGRTFPWNPWAFGVQDSHLHLATHTGILTSNCSNIPSGISSTRIGTLPYPLISQCQSFGILLSPGKFSAQDHSTSELLRTL